MKVNIHQIILKCYLRYFPRNAVSVVEFSSSIYFGTEVSEELQATVQITNGVTCPDDITVFCNAFVDNTLLDPASAGKQPHAW